VWPGTKSTTQPEIEAMKLKHLAKHLKTGRFLATTLALASLVGFGTNSIAGEKKKMTEAELIAQAKVTKEDAEKTALAKVPNGTIKESEIEKEKGKLIWSFDIATPGTKDITEVNVDAMTGALIAVEVEKASDEAKEAKEEKK
jgi:uncharacterized membrane protein YkoI